MKLRGHHDHKLLDLFYTNVGIAKECIAFTEEHIAKKRRKYYLEPACGTGSFSKQLENCVSVDLYPRMKGAKKADFLNLTKKELFPKEKTSNICVIGNPPFGKNSSLAVKFFNHAAIFGDVIAFIVPKTFKKESLQRKLNRNFWLVAEMDIPKNSFTLGDEIHDTPSVFQIWERRVESRSMPKVDLENEVVEFVKTQEEADLAVRRVGGRTGKATEKVFECAPVSHYYLKIKDKDLYSVSSLVETINAIDFVEISNATAGVKSLSKGEFILAFKQALNV